MPVGLLHFWGAADMARRVFGWAVAALLVATAATGCSSSKDKGKNQDLDRPRSTEKK
jgi:hypothetical protein